MNPVESMTEADIELVNHMIAHTDVVNRGDFIALLKEHGAYSAIATALDKSIPIPEFCYSSMEAVMEAWNEEELERDPNFAFYAYLKTIAEPIRLFPHH